MFSRKFLVALFSLTILLVMTSPPLLRPWTETTPTPTPTTASPTFTPTPTATPDPFSTVPTATPWGHGVMILPPPTISPLSPSPAITEE